MLPILFISALIFGYVPIYPLNILNYHYFLFITNIESSQGFFEKKVGESLGLGSCMLGGFYDDEIHKLLKIDGVNEAVVNVMTVGYKKTGNKG